MFRYFFFIIWAYFCDLIAWVEQKWSEWDGIFFEQRKTLCSSSLSCTEYSDLLPEDMIPQNYLTFRHVVPISAITGFGIDQLKSRIRQSIDEDATSQSKATHQEKLHALRHQSHGHLWVSWTTSSKPQWDVQWTVMHESKQSVKCNSFHWETPVTVRLHLQSIDVMEVSAWRWSNSHWRIQVMSLEKTEHSFEYHSSSICWCKIIVVRTSTLNDNVFTISSSFSLRCVVFLLLYVLRILRSTLKNVL